MANARPPVKAGRDDEQDDDADLDGQAGRERNGECRGAEKGDAAMASATAQRGRPRKRIAPARLWRESATPGKTSASAVPATARPVAKSCSIAGQPSGASPASASARSASASGGASFDDQRELQDRKRCEVDRAEHANSPGAWIERHTVERVQRPCHR